ncbi:MAG: alpha/beta hydrolase [Alphaproteobacteria bacterium]|nr:alpha/beta hydrolase [Alphaproteobacteria bacterium]
MSSDGFSIAPARPGRGSPIERATRLTLRAAFGIAVLALLATGCSPLVLLNWANPEPAHDRLEFSYGPGARQRLDLYRPKDLKTSAPVVIFFYGGGWEGGERGNYRFAALALVEQGFVVAVPDYRVYPEVGFPGFLEDTAEAAAWIHREVASHGGDPDRLFLMGHSAGAYNAVMLALDADRAAAAGLPSSAIRGVVGLAGPYDFLPMTSKTLQAIFAAPDMARTQPITFARADAPPVLLATGDVDSTVYPRNTRNLGRRLRDLGAPVETIEYSGLGHAGIVIALAPLFRGTAPVLTDVTRFLKARS